MAPRPELESGQTLDDELHTPLASPPTASSDAGVPKTQESSQIAPQSVPPKSHLPTVARSSYSFGSEVARGGLGRIVHATDLRLNREVAIKELLRPTPASEVRFLREIQATVKLQHPNIVAIHEAGRWPDGQLFYAMNYVSGQTLLEVISHSKTVASRLELLPRVLAITEAVAFAHSEGVIHRDLKPANVLVGRFGETVVIDWGLAKLNGQRERRPTDDARPAETGMTQAGRVVGTPPYMPPEQAAGLEVDERCDVYALGAILYHVLCGHPPYFEDRRRPLLDQIRNGPPTLLGELEPELPPDLLAIVDKAMARDKAERYADAEAMAQELYRFTRGRLVNAYTYRFTDLMGRFVRRNAAAVTTAAIAFVVLLTIASYSIVQVRSERDLARASEHQAKEQLALAKHRTQLMIVNRARALTDLDPTLAVASLKQLDGPERGAPSVAARAEEHGVAKRILRGHDDSVTCIDVAPDGKRLLSGSDDHRVLLWELASGESRLLQQHTDRVTDCVFSPDGRLLASAGYDGHVTLWTADELEETELPVEGGDIKVLAFSEDGQYLATGKSNDRIGLWHVVDKHYSEYPAPNVRWPVIDFRKTHQFLSGPHDGRMRLWTVDGSYVQSPSTELRVTQGQFWEAPDGVVLGTVAGELAEWNARTGSLSTIAKMDAPITALSTATLEPGFAAAATMSGDVVQIDLSTRTTRKLLRHSERVLALQVSPAQRYIASGGWDRQIHVFDVTTDDDQQLRGHTDVISDLAFTPNEDHLITASWDKTIRVWPLRNEIHDRRSVLLGHSVGVHSVRFSPNGRWLASGGHDNTVRLWNLEDKTHRVLEGHTDHVFRVLFSPTAPLLASSSDDRTVRLWSTESYQNVAVLEGHEADVEELAFSPDGRWLLSGSDDHTARLWNVASRESTTLYHDHAVTMVAFSPDGKLFATSSRAGDVRLFETESQTPLERFTYHQGEVHAVAFSPDGHWLASADQSGSVVLFNLDNQRIVRWADLPGAHDIAFSPNGKWLAVAGATPHLWVCDVATAACDHLEAHRSIVRGMKFTPDERMLATAGGEGVTHLWDLETLEYRIYDGHRAPVFDLDISPDGMWIATGSGDATVRLWPRAPVPTQTDLKQVLEQMTVEIVPDVVEEPIIP